MKSHKFPKKHIFSERPKSVTLSQSLQKDSSPKAKITSSREGSNINSPSSKKSLNCNENSVDNMNFMNSIIMNELTFNVNDDHKTLINKNRQLSNLLIQASDKISQLNDKLNLDESRNKKEKEEMITKLDKMTVYYKEKLSSSESKYKKEKEDIITKLEKITVNYKVYAESHQNYIKLKFDFENLNRDNEQIKKILTNYEGIIKISLSNFIQNFKKITEFLVDSKDQDFSIDFVFKLKERFKTDLKEYLSKIEVYNYNEFNTQIKHIKNEIDQYDAEINKFRFSQSDTYKPNNSSENNDKMIIPLMSNSIKQNENSIYLENTISSQLCSPYKEQIRKHLYSSCDYSKDNHFDLFNEKLNQTSNKKENLEIKKIKMERKKTKSALRKNLRKSIDHAKIMESLEKIKIDLDKKNKNDTNDQSREKIYAEAILDFHAKKKNELGFKKGDVLLILDVQDTGWWLANLNGKSGLIPFDYIRIYD